MATLMTPGYTPPRNSERQSIEVWNRSRKEDEPQAMKFKCRKNLVDHGDMLDRFAKRENR